MKPIRNVSKFFGNMFQKDGALRILSLILAVVGWFFVMVTLNPPAEMTIRGVPIQFSEAHLSQLAARDLVIVSDMDLTAQVGVQGSRNAVAELAARNIPISVNLSGIDGAGTFEVPVTVNLPLAFPFHEINITMLYPLTILVEVDDVIERKIDVRVEFDGELSDGFIVDDFNVTPATVAVRGPAGDVRNISLANVIVPLSNQTNDFSVEDLAINFASRGEDATPIHHLEFDVDELLAAVDVTVLSERTVPIIPILSGEFENLIENGTYTLNVTPSEVVIVGNSSVIGGIDEISTTLAVFAAASGEGIGFTATLVIPEGTRLRDEIGEVYILLESAE